MQAFSGPGSGGGGGGSGGAGLPHSPTALAPSPRSSKDAAAAEVIRQADEQVGILQHCIRQTLEPGVFLLRRKSGGQDTGELLRQILREQADELHAEDGVR